MSSTKLTAAQSAGDEKKNVSYLIQKGNIRARIAEKKEQTQSQLVHNLLKRPLEFFLVGVQVVCLGLTLFLMSYEDSRVDNKLVMNNLFTGQTDSEDMGDADGEKRLTILLQYLGLFISGFVILVTMVVYAVAIRLHWSTSTTYTALALLLLCMTSDLINVAYPTDARLGAVISMGSLRLISLFLVVILNIWLGSDQRKSVGQELPLLLQSFQEISGFIGVDDPNIKIPMVLLEELESWIVEARGRRAFVRGRTSFLTICCVLFFVFTGTVFTESEKVLFEQNPDLQLTSLNRITERVEYVSTLGKTRTQTSKRVVVINVSGLRYDSFTENSALATFYSSISDYSKLYKFKTSVPSTTVAAMTTFVTGSSPEFHGQLNDYSVQETSADTLFNVTRLYSVRSAMIADGETARVVRGLISPLDGDGTIPTGASSSLQSLVLKSVSGVDKQRSTLLNAAALSKNYEFIIAKFDNAHVQAQMRGVDKRWNSDDSYNAAIDDIVSDLYDFWETLDTNTVVFLMSDHGHIDRGGTGGVHSTVTDIPLLMYNSGNGLSSTWSYSGALFEKDTWDIRDLTPTICAILGIPAPRHNFGLFFDDAMIFATASSTDRTKHYQDLFYQRQSLYYEWFSEHDQHAAQNKDIMSTSYVSGMTETEVRDAINTLDDHFSYNKNAAYATDLSRNFCVSFALMLIVVGITAMVLQNGTLADPSSAFFQPCIIQRTRTSLYTRTKNVTAIVLTFLFVAWYYILAITSFCLGLLACGFLDSKGVIIWDSSIVSNPAKGGSIFIILSIIPGCIIYPIIKRVETAMLVNFLERTERLEFVETMRTLAQLFFQPSRLTFRDYGLLYLLNIYMLFWTMFSCQLVLFLASDFTFIVPMIFRLKYIDGSFGFVTRWGYRFRIITMMYITLPLLVGTLLSTYNWQSQRITARGIGSLHQLAEQKGNIYIALFGGFKRRRKDAEVARAIERELREGKPGEKKSAIVDGSDDEGKKKDIFGNEVDDNEYSINFIMASKQQVAEHCIKLQHKLASLEKEAKVLKQELEEEKSKEKETGTVVRGQPLLDSDDDEISKQKEREKEKEEKKRKKEKKNADDSTVEGIVVSYEGRLKKEKALVKELQTERAELQECYKECAAERKVILEKLLAFNPHFPMDKKDPFRRKQMRAMEADLEDEPAIPAGKKKKADARPTQETPPFE